MAAIVICKALSNARRQFGVVGGTYLAFTTTNNPALAAAIPLISAFAICPALCAVMGGIM